MKISFRINEDGYIVAKVNEAETELCGLDWISEFPEDACEQVTERLQKLLDEEEK